MKKLLAVILILVGAFIMMIPTLKDNKVEQTVQETVKIVEAITPEVIEENEANEEAQFDYSVVEDITVTGTLLGNIKANPKLLVGQLVIPSVGMNISIFKGINNTNLLAGAATMRANQKMGEGNYPLAGHYSKNKDILFGSLMDVQVGDPIRITNKKTIYEYTVYEVKVVPDDALYIIDDKVAALYGKPVISLMTCYYSSKTGKRYFVLGELTKTYPYSEEVLFND